MEVIFRGVRYRSVAGSRIAAWSNAAGVMSAATPTISAVNGSPKAAIAARFQAPPNTNAVTGGSFATG